MVTSLVSDSRDPETKPNNPLLDAALAYARDGFPVLPLKPGQKEPLGRLAPRGFKDATTDERRIRRWWREEPDANIGLACGDGLTVLDVDPRNGGDASLADLLEGHGPLRTQCVRTGSGGAHFYFHDDENEPIRPGSRGLGPGLEIKGKGGYVVAPPSVHPNGERYHWANDLERAAPPPWLRRLAGTRDARSDGPVGIPPSRWAPGDDLEERLRWTREVVDHIANDDRFPERADWIGVGYAILASCGGYEGHEAFEIFDGFSQRWEEGECDDEETVAAWASLNNPVRPGGYPKLLRLAKEYEFPADHPWHPSNEFEANPDATPADRDFRAILQALAGEKSPRQLRSAIQEAWRLLPALGEDSAVASAMFRAALHRGFGWRHGDELWNLGEASVDGGGSASILLSELAEGEVTEPEFVIPYVVPWGRAVLLAGPDKSGKSTFVAHAVAAHSNRVPFLGEPLPDGLGKALIAAPDESVQDTRNRLTELGADPTQVEIVTRAGPDLTELIQDRVATGEFSLVVVDSLIEYARRVRGTVPDSGSAAQWASVVRPLVAIAHDHNVALVILHHTRKSDGEFRDSGEIAAAVDGTLTMRIPKAGRSKRRFDVRARWKSRRFAVDIRDGQYVITRWGSRAGEAPVASRILSWLCDHPGASKTALREGVGANRDAVYSELHRLIREGAIRNDGTGRAYELHVVNSVADFEEFTEDAGEEEGSDVAD